MADERPNTVSGHPSSRESRAGAGWTDCRGPGTWTDDVPAGTRPLSWLRPSTRFWVSRNDIIAQLLYDPVDRARTAWVQAAARTRPRRRFRRGLRHATRRRQRGVVPAARGPRRRRQQPVRRRALARVAGRRGTVRGPLQRRRLPERRDERLREALLPALPRAEAADLRHSRQPRLVRRAARLHASLLRPRCARPSAGDGADLRGILARALWRRSKFPSAIEMAAMHRLRSAPEQVADPPQPASYWAIDAGPSRIVAIDTGIVGAIDGEQAVWLRRVSLGSDRP